MGIGNNNLVPFVGMVLAILAQTSNMVIAKTAMSHGTNKFIMVVYSNTISSLILLPCSFFYHRSNRPSMTSSLFGRFFLLALFGCSGQIFGYVGIEYSSPTLGTTMFNLIPAFTFILAVIFRMETLYWRSSSSQAKILGTIMSMIGAFVVIFYKGPPVVKRLPISNLSNQLLFSSHSHWILGGFFLASDCFVSSLWYIVQASTQKKYPAVLLAVLYQISLSAVMSAIFALIVVKDASAWKLKLDMGLVSILHTAIVSTVIRYSLITWCVSKAGAFYCAMFKPLGIIFTVFMGAIFLGESFYLGSLIGATIIVTGFYVVMRGKAKDQEKVDSSESSLDHNSPLLLNKAQDKQELPI
ncbi:Auxin-induced protein 5NG4 [Morus notabilis]|uniref:WAT1-related protein n=2 Tax=Morus notabilis TaxID=981085 RepID=W9S1W9_9ROSA|nr:Auxin-induced protein 5NG4 [Morus notabilis]